MDDLIFGTENLRDSAAKLTQIYLRVKGGSTLGNDDYEPVHVSCDLSDIETINLFTKQLGSKRLATTALLCAGFSLIQNELNKFPVPIYDIAQVFARINCSENIDYVLKEETVLNMVDNKKGSAVIKRITVYIPNMLWGMIYNTSLSFKIKFSSFVLYLLRTGVAEYNNFTSRFSSTSMTIPPEFISVAERRRTIFISNIAIKYHNLVGEVKYLYDVYDKELDNGHEDLKKEMKRIIDKSTNESTLKGGTK